MNTQRLLAITICFTALTNWPGDGDGIHNLSAPRFMR